MWRDPLLRTGHLLTLSSVGTSAIGLAYWALAARRYDSATVGRNYAAISMMMFLAVIAQLNLSSALVRFLPIAGSRTLRLVVSTYVVSGLLAVAASGCFLALVHHIAPGLAFLADDPLLGICFIAAVAGHALYVLKDGVLTGLRCAAWVPLTNTVFALAKVLLVVLLAAALPAYGIFVSWLLALGVTLLIANGFLIRSAGARSRNGDDGSLPPSPQIVRFVAVDYLGEICAVAATALLPVLVINAVGPEQSANFTFAWIVAYPLQLVSLNMGASLVVETAADQAQLGRRCRQVLVHTGMLLVPAVLLVIVAAPYLLSIFGPTYRSASGLLQMLALSAIPNLFVYTAVSSARAQRRMSVVVALLGSLCALALTLSWLLLDLIGINGVGLGWLIAQSLVAGVLLIRRDLWLNVTGTRHRDNRTPDVGTAPKAMPA